MITRKDAYVLTEEGIIKASLSELAFNSHNWNEIVIKRPKRTDGLNIGITNLSESNRNANS